MPLISLQQNDIPIGVPLTWHVVDGEGKVIFERGQIINNPPMLAQLFKLGLFRMAAEQSNAVDQGKLSGRTTTSLSHIHLTPGDSVQLQIMQNGETKRFNVKMIGCYAPVSVLVTAPMQSGKLAFIKEGQPFLVRGFVGKDAIAYKTRVLKSNLAPFPYLHLAYPDNVQSMRIRNSARVALELPADISQNGIQVATATMIDLSVGGARLSSPTPFGAVDDEVAVAVFINPAGMEVYLKVEARIRMVSDEDDLGSVTTGVEFINLSQQDRLYLSSMVYQNLASNEM